MRNWVKIVVDSFYTELYPLNNEKKYSGRQNKIMTIEYERIQEDFNNAQREDNERESEEIEQSSLFNSVCVVIGLTLLPITGMVMAVVIYSVI